MVAVPPPPTSPERRLPLRQLPSERSFSASPRNVDPVRNDWVLPLLNSVSLRNSAVLSDLRVNRAPFHTQIAGGRGEPRRDENCHFNSDEFCLFESKPSLLTTRNQLDSLSAKIFF